MFLRNHKAETPARKHKVVDVNLFFEYGVTAKGSVSTPGDPFCAITFDTISHGDHYKSHQ